MSLYKLVILEDEPLVAKDLVSMVKKLDPGISIEAIVDSIELALEWFPAHSLPDLVLADIQLSDGISFDIFKKLKLDVPVIFTTAYDEYAIRAFKVNGIDYLLKPVDFAELNSAWSKFLKTKNEFSFVPGKLKEMLSDMGLGHKKYKERFTVHSGQHSLAVPATDTFLFKREELIFLVSKEGKQFICDYNSLEELEELLDPALFFRANRQTIIQLNAIQSYKGSYNGKIEIKLRGSMAEDITVSREKATQFKEWFEG